jgi:hypothetical protein
MLVFVWSVFRICGSRSRLAEVGLFGGLGVAGILRITGKEFLVHTILLNSNTVPWDQSTNQEMSSSPGLLALIECSVQKLVNKNSKTWIGEFLRALDVLLDT